jgi:hypothetical protein
MRNIKCGVRKIPLTTQYKGYTRIFGSMFTNVAEKVTVIMVRTIHRDKSNFDSIDIDDKP